MRKSELISNYWQSGKEFCKLSEPIAERQYTMKILNATQIRELDAYTIEHEPIRSIDLMERAAGRCFEWIKRRMREKKTVQVFCGMGNNGGDGLAIGRMLGGTGHQVIVHIVRHASDGSQDFQQNLKRLNGVRNLKVNDLDEAASLPEIGQNDLVIDALFGSGLNRPLAGLPAKVVGHINACGAVVVSIDVPSGLFCEDNTRNDPGTIIRADYTLSLQLPKLSFLFADNESYVGQWEVLDIGLHQEGIARSDSKYFMIAPGMLKAFYRPRARFSHKGNFGHGLLIAGSLGKMGAALIAAKACMRSGAGLLSVFLPEAGMLPIQTFLPEAMCLPANNREMIDGLPPLDAYNAIGIGPGLGTTTETGRALKLLLQQTACPLVLDADALNILAENPTWCGFLPAGSVLTPHPGEFERLAGKSTNGYERLMKAREFAHRFQVTLVLKGAFTAVISPTGVVYFNPTGNPGLASGGSGDALTGMILGWMTQHYSSLQSSLAGVFTHGLAADLAIKGRAFEGLIVTDLVDKIPAAIQKTFY
jgi:ADP-dependent NAD(P)H-hydrate dehydratase / NAD(P)H-hydrate epimerase